MISISKKNVVFILIFFAIIAALLALPTGFEDAQQFKDAEKCKVLVEAVDNSSLINTGLIRTGQQVCTVRFLSGKFKMQTAEGWNMLGGSLSQDKLFRPGDKAQAVVHHYDGEIISVNLIDYYRLDGELLLALPFCTPLHSVVTIWCAPWLAAYTRSMQCSLKKIGLPR